MVGLSFLGYGAQTVLAETPAADTTATSEASPVAASEAVSEAASEAAPDATLRAAATTSNVDSVPADGQTFASDALPTAEQLIANAAELQAAGATISYKEAPAVGKGYAVVTVTYADGSVREVTVLTTVNDSTKQELVQDAVPSGTDQEDADSTVNGYVTYNRRGNPNNRDVDNAVPLEGVTVYGQWFERDGSASPVYSTVTGADGSFHIIMKPFIKADGSTAQFDADVNLPEGEKFRIWAENPDPTKYDGLFQYMNGQVGPRIAVFNTNGGAWYDLGPNRLNDVNIQFADVKDPEGMHDIANATTNEKEGLYGNIDGKVFWNNRVLAGGLDLGTLSDFNNGDVPVRGITVYGTYLSDAAIAKIMAEAPAVLGTNNIRGFGWTMENEAALQDWIKEQIAIDGKDFWLAETVSAVTDANGDYSLQFNGTYGVSWDNVGTFADANANALKGTVADSPSTGRWATSAGDISRSGSNVSKHINKDWLFISTEKLEGVSQITEWRNNWFMGPSANFGVGTLNYNSLRNADFALQPEQIIFDVTPYDSFSNFAAPGESVETNTAGLPNAFAGNQQYAIEWTDSKGNVIVPATPVNVNEDGTIPSVPFTVPADLVGTETYTAKLYSLGTDGKIGDMPLAQDSFTANADRQNEVNEPSYDMTLVTPGTPATSTPTFTDKDANEVTPPAGTKFEIPADYTAPEGYTVTIDENTGVVTVTAPDSPIATTVESFEVPVKVTYPDNSVDETVAPFQLDTDGNGTPDVTDADDDGDGIPDTDDNNPKTFTTTTVSVDDATVVEGNPVNVPVTVTTDDKNATVEVKDLPDGLTYVETTDETTGETTREITGTPTVDDWGTDEETRDHTVTVEVKDKDGNVVATDTAVITVQRDTDGDGTPDVTDTDDDGDGVPDTEEATDGTNPKDPNSVGSAITPIDDQTGVVGEPIKPVPVDVVKVPTGGTVEVTGLPDGVTYDPSTGEITGTPTTPGTSTVTVTVLDKDGNPVTDKDGNPVTETFTFTVTDPSAKDADVNDPSYEDKTGNPGDPVVVPAPTNPDGTKVPDGSTFESNNPNVVVDPNTGEVTVTIPEDATPGDVIEGTITITYPDGSTDEVPVKVVVTDPNTPDNQENDPSYEDKTGNPGDPVVVPAPTNPNGTKVPDGSTFESDNPNVVVDPNTGEVTVTIPEDATPGDVIEGTITITYPDGSTDEVPVKVVVTDPNTPDDQENDPKYTDGSGEPGTGVKVPAPTNPDGTKVPDGSTFESNNPNVVVDPNTGEVTVTIPEDATPGDVIEGTITITYPDGSKDEVPVKVTVYVQQNGPGTTTPELPSLNISELFTPESKDQTVNVGETPKAEDSISNLPDLPDGTTVEFKDPIDTTTPGEKDGTVVVTYPDGSTDEVPVKVVVTEPNATDADNNDPSYPDASGEPGTEVKVPAPTNLDGSKVPDGSKFESDNPAIEVDPNTGEVTVKIPDGAKPGDVIEGTITITYPDGSTDEVPVKVVVAEPKATTDTDNNDPKHDDATDTDNNDPKHDDATDTDNNDPKHDDATDTDNNDPKHDDATGNSVKETTQIATNEVVNRRQSDASTKYQAKLPETGEESNMGILAGTAILFAVGALGKRKKKED